MYMNTGKTEFKTGDYVQYTGADAFVSNKSWVGRTGEITAVFPVTVNLRWDKGSEEVLGILKTNIALVQRPEDKATTLERVLRDFIKARDETVKLRRQLKDLLNEEEGE